jgi:hypothetical protein
MPSIPNATRAQIVTLKALGYTNEEICSKLHLALVHRSLDRIYARALDRGFNPEKPTCLDDHVSDASRSGRPTKQTEQAKAGVEAKVTTDRYGREKSAEVIAAEVGLSTSTVRTILKKAGYKKTKPTRKPGLTEEMKKARLEFCRAHVDKGDDFWHNIIWTDETSVILGQRRGGYKVWRKSNERVLRSVIRPRWKGFSEFMFWGSFTYKEKGPCHIYSTENAVMKKQALKEVEELNETLEPLKRAEWEQAQEEKRRKMRRRPSRVAIWRWDKDHGKLSRSERGGIDWYRYWKEIQTKKLIPFAKKVNGILVEDGAGCHKHWYVQLVYNIEAVNRLAWCGNSPDLNAIEPLWFKMKRDTTKKGAPQSRADAVRKWNACWEEVSQEVLQQYVDRIREHMKRVIECEGGNEYEEGLKTRETLKRERVEKRVQEKVEKERRLQEMIDQQSQVRLIKRDNQAKRKEFLAQERLKDKEKEKKEREAVRDARLKEFERLREQRAQQKLEKKEQQKKKQEQKQEQKREQKQELLRRQQQLEQKLDMRGQIQHDLHQRQRQDLLLREIELQIDTQQEEQWEQMEEQQRQQREQMELEQRRRREQIELEQRQRREQIELEQQQQREQLELELQQQREQMELKLQQQREQLEQELQQQREQQREPVEQRQQQARRKLQLDRLRRLELQELQQRELLQQQEEQQREQEQQHEQEVQQQIEREIDEMECHKQAEIQVERKHDKKGYTKQLPEQPQTRQARVLRKCERQGNVDTERHNGEGGEVRQEAADTEMKQHKGKAKQLAKQPEKPEKLEKPEPLQAGRSRVLRKRERG